MSRVVDVAAPLHFRPCVGTPRNVHLTLPPYPTRRGNTAAREAGLRYERLVQAQLQTIWPAYRTSPWLAFTDETGERRCSPDGIFFDKRTGVACVVEIKLQHMPEAWFQLRKLYEPVVKRLYPNSQVSVVEIVKSFDPSMPFPEEIILLTSFEDLLHQPEKFGVLCWKP